MDHLWSPWRYRYVTDGAREKPDCIFCAKGASIDDEQNLIVFRGAHCYGLLNLYPYTNGHMMIAPHQHAATIESLDEAVWIETMRYARLAERNIRVAYKCDGLNLGFNIGGASGAGIAQHLHLHVLPRWEGDANFMSVIGETRVHPESLADSWRKLAACDWRLSGL